LAKAGIAIKDALLFRKLIVFLKETSSVPEEDRKKIVESLNDSRTAEKFGEKLIILLERMDSSQKSSLLGKTFRILAEKKLRLKNSGEFHLLLIAFL